MSGQAADRAALDAEFNLRAAVPEFQAYFDRYDAMSAEFRARRPGRLDLPYGDGPNQAIDLFLPETANPPLLAFIHGGYWHTQDRKRFSFVAEPLLERGIAAALIGYDLAPAADMDAIVEEIRTALGWLHRRGQELGFDPDRMYVAGHSAGGHLSAMALATEWREIGLPDDVIKGVCAISGVFDLEPVRLCYLNDVLAMNADQARRNSPIHLVPRTGCRVLVTVGAKETQAFLDQSRHYAGMLREAGVPCEHRVLPDLDHFAIVEALARPDNAMVEWLAKLARTS